MFSLMYDKMSEQNHSNYAGNKQGSASAALPGQGRDAWDDSINQKLNNDVAKPLGSINLQGDRANPGGLGATTKHWGVSIQSSAKNGDSTSQMLFLRPWIQQTLHTIGDRNGTRAALSPLYLECCIKIALELIEQIIQAEKLATYGINDKLALLPIRNNVNWAKYTRITLGQEEARQDHPQIAEHQDNGGEQDCEQSWKSEQLKQASGSNALGDKEADQDSCCNSLIATFDWESGAMVGSSEHNTTTSQENSLQYLRLDSCEASTSNNTDEDAGALDRDLNSHLDAFLTNFVVDKIEAEAGDTYERESVSASNSVDRKETTLGNDRSASATYSSDSKSASANLMLESLSNTETKTNYLNIDSAQIKCPESSLRNYTGSDDNLSREKHQRIFYLALLFYELFSGGETPAANICALGMSRGAFVSLPTLTLAEEIENSEDIFSEPKRRHGPAGSGRKMSLCKLYFEHLKFMSIPGPICHLIFNMLDCVYGDLSGEECYNDISDVKYDLQLMLSKPKFLHGLDTNDLSSSSCLQLNSNLISREEELQSIHSSYQRCQSGSSELAIIKGESGSGKTWLAHHVGNFIIADGGLFLTGKFDQLQQRRPFSALASAFDQYCDILIRQKESDWAGAVVRNLHSTFGQDISYLIKVIPKLGQIVGNNAYTSTSSEHDNDSGNIMQRIKYLLCQFVEVINAHSIASITLFLDDLQWADEASTAVIDRLVLTQARKKFFFLGCCRDNEMNDDHLFWKAIEDFRANGINTIISQTKSLTVDTINDVISDMLCLSPRIVKPLSSIVYNKTKGNFLFISQLLLSLSRDGMLRIDLGSQRWVWDHDKIYMAKLPDNVAICFTDGIKKLPNEVQLALHILSMFGARTKMDYIKALESDLQLRITEPLKKAAAEGLVSEIDESFQFCHDRIQEASYQIIQEHERRCNHLTYGLCLVKRALEIGDDEMLFIALNQINFGGPSAVTHESEYFVMANYNLAAAKKAVAMSDFHTAYSFCDNGISFLRFNHWRDHYEFSIELFNLASRCALATGNVEGLHILSSNMLKNARCFEDKLNVYFCVISSQAMRSKTTDTLDKGLDIVSQLGEDIPRRPSEFMIDQQMQQTMAITRGMTEEIMMSYRIMSDVKKLAAMRFLTKLQNTAFFVNHIVHSYIVLKLVQITISFGLSPQSPAAIATFGTLLVREGNIKMGGRFTMIAKSLSEKMGSNEYASEVYFMVGASQSFLQPLSAANEYHVQGERAGLSAGDIHFACMNRLIYSLNSYWIGHNLSAVERVLSDACLFMKDHNHKNSLQFLLMLRSTVMMLVDSDTEVPRRNELIRTLQESSTFRVQMTMCFHNVYISFLLHQGDLRELCEKRFDMDCKSGIILYTASAHRFILGLAAFRLYRKHSDFVWAERGRDCIKDVKVWAEQGSTWNFEQKLKLLEAEENYCLGDFDGAKISYQDAISAARMHKNLLDEALACELAADFYFQTGDASTSLKHYRIAREVYCKYGADGKANDLFSSIKDKFSNVFASGTS